MRDFRNKVIVITGAANGMGVALSKRFVSEGALVVVSDLNATAITKLSTILGATSIVADVSVEADVKNLVERVLAQFGRIDMFISNSGISFAGGVNVPGEEWKKAY